MPYDPYKHHRRSIRLKGYDYSLPGVYFVTIVTQNREPLFGRVVDGQMVVNAYGRIVAEEWQRTAELRPNVTLDAFVVMPNHFHGILLLTDQGGGRRGRGTMHRAPTDRPRFAKPSAGSLSSIVGTFKAAVTRRVNRLNNTPGASLWQRNYFEHIIRNPDELDQTRAYIGNNPAHWDLDAENPAASR